MAYMDDRYGDRDYFFEDDNFHARGPQWEQRQADDKFRRLPCRTFISTGTCPYRERCVYLHDPRIATKSVKSKSRKKNKDDVATDAWFWPVMPDGELQVDHAYQPIVNQYYVVPVPHFEQCSFHNRSVYSIWMHFVEYCIDSSARSSERTNLLMIHGQHQIFCHPSEVADFRAGRRKAPSVVNMYSGQKRLETFIHLSNGAAFLPPDSENTPIVSVAPHPSYVPPPATASPPTVSIIAAMPSMTSSQTVTANANDIKPGLLAPPGLTSGSTADRDWEYANFASASAKVPTSAPVAEVFYHFPSMASGKSVGAESKLHRVPAPIAAHWGKHLGDSKVTSAVSGLALPSFSMSFMW